jgi:hypothetical protein
MGTTRRALLAAIALVVVAAAGACARHQSPAQIRGAEQHAAQAFDQRAAQVVQQWSGTAMAKAWTSGFVPLQELLVPPPTPTFSYSTGTVTISAAAPPAPPASGHVRFADGDTLTVPLESWADASSDFQTTSGFPACPAPLPQSAPLCSLTITRIALGTTMLWTSRGEARVPAWLMTVSQLPGPIARVAVPLSAMVAAPPAQRVFPTGVNETTSLDSVDGARISVTLLTGTCDEDIQARTYETPTAVVIGAIHASKDEICTLEGHATSASVTLRAPLGNRALLDISTGYPLVLGAYTEGRIS